MTEQEEQEAGDTDTGILLAHAIAIHVLFSEMANMLTNEAREKFEAGVRLKAAHLMSGATCDIHGVPKTEQRGMVQPFIAAMQTFALVLLLMQRDLSVKVLVDFVIGIPALLAGAMLGIFAFRCVDEILFRRIILSILLLSSVMLIV